MSKFIAVYEVELDFGQIPDQVAAGFLKNEDKAYQDSIWEYGNPKLLEVKTSE